jgi:hypothetical protein
LTFEEVQAFGDMVQSTQRRQMSIRNFSRRILAWAVDDRLGTVAPLDAVASRYVQNVQRRSSTSDVVLPTYSMSLHGLGSVFEQS